MRVFRRLTCLLICYACFLISTHICLQPGAARVCTSDYTHGPARCWCCQGSVQPQCTIPASISNRSRFRKWGSLMRQSSTSKKSGTELPKAGSLAGHWWGMAVGAAFGAATAGGGLPAGVSLCSAAGVGPAGGGGDFCFSKFLP